MAKKGRRTTQKSLSVARVRKRKVKERNWSISASPGPYCKSESIPLGVLLRDLVGLGGNLREIKFMLRSKKIKVNRKVRTDYKFGVGIFDIVEMPEAKKAFRIVVEKKGRLAAKEISFEKNALKLCRVESKKTVKGGNVGLSTNDGHAIVLEKTSLKPGDSLKINLDSGEIISLLPLSEGNIVLLVGGKHCGQTAVLKQVAVGKLRRKKLLTLEKNGEIFQTTQKNVFVVGVAGKESEVSEWCL